GSGYSLFSGSIVLAIMILPTIATLSEDALGGVLKDYKMASMALGATKWQTIYKVILPSASQGLITAIILGMGRAIGETMAVLMILGNAPIVPTSINQPMSTLTSVIALDMSYASGNHQVALFAMGIVLLLISMSMIGIVRTFSYYRGLNR
ncbi:MAG: ABC transporter permease subunit, partial [Actinomycetia bacterium]|nr:ABC transporter permease subunit [Actinomycetes bacterium]